MASQYMGCSIQGNFIIIRWITDYSVQTIRIYLFILEVFFLCAAPLLVLVDDNRYCFDIKNIAQRKWISQIFDWHGDVVAFDLICIIYKLFFQEQCMQNYMIINVKVLDAQCTKYRIRKSYSFLFTTIFRSICPRKQLFLMLILLIYNNNNIQPAAMLLFMAQPAATHGTDSVD